MPKIAGNSVTPGRLSKPDRAKSQGAGGDKEGSVAHGGTKEEWAGLEGKMDEELVVWEEELLALETGRKVPPAVNNRRPDRLRWPLAATTTA